jgi:NAD dependent epimerase/dehydratase family enzyme
MILGDKADLVLHGQRVSGRKLFETGFECRFSQLQDALDDLN